MDLNEYKKLQAETESYRNTLENVNFEKIALDREYVSKLQQCLQLQTQLIKKDVEIQAQKNVIEKLKIEKDSEIQLHKNEIEKLKVELESIKAKNAETEIADIIDSSPASNNCL